MKNLITAIIILLITCPVFAQSFQNEMEIFQEAFGLEKKKSVANFMQLEEDSEDFWKIYNDYEFERKEVGKERIKIIVDYVESYPNLTDEEILNFFKRTKAMRYSNERLLQKYFDQMRKELNVSTAAQFWQLESYFNAMIKVRIYSELPFIGEVK